MSVDGNPLEYTLSELPNPQGADKPPLPWASFAVTFLPGKETVIHVSYVLPLQPVPKQPVMNLNYIFQTGAGWVGPIRQAKLILNLPYPASEATMAKLPLGAVLEENTARWTWQNFEPGPEDDFTVWLLQPSKWRELETARIAVKVKPQDGLAWLDLAYQYYSMSLASHGRLLPLSFSHSYTPQAITAYQKAAELLPENPVPHVALALLNLAQYMQDKNAPPKVIQFIQGEYQLAKDLAERNPSVTVEGELMALLEDALYAYFSNDATATVDAATQSAERARWNATQTAETTRDYATITVWAIGKATALAWQATDMTCWATAGAECTATVSPTVTHTPRPTNTATSIPSATPQPAPSTPALLAQPGQTAGQSPYLVIIGVSGVIVLVVAGYLTVKSLQKHDGK